MAIRESLQTSALTLGDLFANGRSYRVPPFQRSYSWTETEWHDLWADLEAAEAADRDHYLGAIVLQRSEGSETFDVIDGQQRLATLSIVVLAAIAELDSWAAADIDAAANTERGELFRERFVSPKDPTSLKRGSRLHLNLADDPFFQSAIVNGHAPANARRLVRSQKALWDAWGFFRHRIHGRFGQAHDGPSLATFVDRVLARRVVLIEIVVDDEAAAYTVFETLNARGVALGTADLLKNYLFAMAATGGQADLDEMHRLWERLVDVVPLDRLADLVHHHANTRSLDVSKRQVFRHVRERVIDKRGAFDYLAELLEAADWYAALLDPHDEMWIGMERVRDWVRVLVLLNVEQYRPLALAAAPRLRDRPDDLERLFRVLAIFSVRANLVVQLNSGDVYRAWNRAAVAVSNGRATTPAGIAREAAAIYPDDDAFRAAFAELRIPAEGRRKRQVRYLLAGLEADASGRPVDWETDPFTIEHVLPRSPGAGWESFDERDRERFVSRIGNYVPLEAAVNRRVGDLAYGEKLAAYASSAYALPRQLDGSEWTPASVQQRCRDYARRAAHVWRLGF